MQIIILFCDKEEKRHYMKIQSKILLERFKKNILYIAIYLISLIFGVILFYLRNKQIEFNIDEFLVLINFQKFSNLSYLYELIKIYEIGLLVYLVYDYYTYDVNYSLDNIMIRESVNKWYLNKIIIFSIFITLFKIFEVSILYLIHSSEVSFDINFYIYSIIFDIFVLLIITTLYNYRRSILNYIFLSIILIYIYLRFNAIIVLISSIFMFIFNYKTINFTKNFTK
mgnify:CR=1 FL=1